MARPPRQNTPQQQSRQRQRGTKPAAAAAEQLVLPFALQLGDIVLEDGARLEVVGRPTGVVGGKMTRAWVREEGQTGQREAVWEAWRKVRVVRKPAA